MRAAIWHKELARRAAQMRRRYHGLPWGAFLVVFLIAVVIPTAIVSWLGNLWPDTIEILHTLVATVYALTSLMLLWEACAAWRDARRPSHLAQSLDADFPLCTAIIAAYLPNEQDIILETVQHMLSEIEVPADKFEVILAYNTPEYLPVERALQALASSDARFRPLKVAGSRSKAENVNAAVELARGTVIGVYDADHFPEPACFRKAWQWLANGYAMVQGRCVIRNGSDNWLTRTVDVEFDCIYGVSHQGRAQLSGSGIFGGSNGYWRRDALHTIQMDPSMLTEDIDLSVRALLAGYKLAHDRTIVSEELAPTEFHHWMFQRKRWSQGWLEVTIRHLRSLMASRHLTPTQKILWFYLLGWRECYPIISMLFFPLLFSSWILGIQIQWFGTPFFIATGILNLGIGPLVVWIAYQRAHRAIRTRLNAWYFVYALTGLIYTTVKTTVALIAQYSHIVRERAWVTTPRTARDKAAPSLK